MYLQFSSCNPLILSALLYKHIHVNYVVRPNAVSTKLNPNDNLSIRDYISISFIQVFLFRILLVLETLSLFSYLFCSVINKTEQVRKIRQISRLKVVKW